MEEKIESVLQRVRDWVTDGVDGAEDFDDSFLSSLEDQYEQRGTLSPKQDQAIRNICARWVDK